MDRPGQEAFDAKVRTELRSIPVPKDLRGRILAQRQPAKIISANFWKPALGIAAALAFLATTVLMWNRPPGEDQTFAGFQSRMASFAVRQYSMDIFTSDYAEVRRHLSAKGAPADLEFPAPLQRAPVMGGAKLEWQGHPVAMVCFRGPSDQTLYLFVIDSGAAAAEPEPRLAEVKGLSTASWAHRGKTYLLGADLPLERIRELSQKEVANDSN